MCIAMFVGMIALGPLWTVTFSALGLPRLHDNAELHALVMATNMTIGMSAWMRFRGCSWPAIAEMAPAMYVPFVALFPFMWADVITRGTMFTLGHVLMLPAMWLVMLRRKDEYMHSHKHHKQQRRVTVEPSVAPEPAARQEPA
ncbi:hypothetical protein [Micromonospora echinofusca]|uniref:hypothetical protein n=1 Tax=Micromonospora echinofusca TaxID=47858 RepID=UPI001AD67E0C|nr:hypothetical protein [Micromonospora echinofusca]